MKSNIKIVIHIRKLMLGKVIPIGHFSWILILMKGTKRVHTSKR